MRLSFLLRNKLLLASTQNSSPRVDELRGVAAHKLLPKYAAKYVSKLNC